MRQFTIRNLDGDPIHTGKFETRKEFLQHLIDEGASFESADLRGIDFSRLDISGLDFSSADLTGASLKGVKAEGTNFRHTILDAVRAEGMHAAGAQFQHALARPAKLSWRESIQVPSFDGSVLTHSRFDGAVFEYASFEFCALTGASFGLAKIFRSIFAKSLVRNADWASAEVLYSDFRDAEMHATTMGTMIPRSSLPDRTAGTVAIGNNYKGAVLDESASSFQWDRMFGKIANQVAWGASAAAMLVATSYVPMDDGMDWLGRMIGQGTVVIGLVGFLSLAAEKIGDKLKDQVTDRLVGMQLKLRELGLDAKKRGFNIKEMVVAMGRGPGLKPLRKALAATANRGEQKSNFLKNLAFGNTNMVVCDRGHMARALEWISSGFRRTRLLKNDYVISRVGKEGDDAPSILKFFAGGGMAAFWTENGQVRRAVEWSADDMESNAWEDSDYDALPGTTMSALQVRILFEEAVVADHLPDVALQFNRATESIRAGQDGSIVIMQDRTQLARNKNGAVLIRPNGTEYSEEDARALARMEEAEAAESIFSR